MLRQMKLWQSFAAPTSSARAALNAFMYFFGCLLRLTWAATGRLNGWETQQQATQLYFHSRAPSPCSTLRQANSFMQRYLENVPPLSSFWTSCLGCTIRMMSEVSTCWSLVPVTSCKILCNLAYAESLRTVSWFHVESGERDSRLSSIQVSRVK